MLSLDSYRETALEEFDYGFAENGLTAFKLGKPLETQSFIKFLGEEKYKRIVNFILHYVADLDIPIKRCCSSDTFPVDDAYPSLEAPL